jgi:hypothetical protein
MGKRIIGSADRGRNGAANSPQRSRRCRTSETHTVAGELAIEMIDESGRAIPFECFDLSAVGVYLYSDLLLSPGELVQLRLRLPWSARPILVRGEVVRAEPEDGVQSPGMGVAFRDLGADVAQELRSYVARRFFRHATSR